jgi:hypothetical protein
VVVPKFYPIASAWLPQGLWGVGNDHPLVVPMSSRRADPSSPPFAF